MRSGVAFEDRYAHLRLVKPAEGGRLRLFDVEVSSDAGATWRPLPGFTAHVEQSVNDLPSLTVSVSEIPGVIELSPWSQRA